MVKHDDRGVGLLLCNPFLPFLHSPEHGRDGKHEAASQPHWHVIGKLFDK